MFHNYLTVALRNLVRNKLYAAINIIGLAVGFAAALFIAVFVRHELSYDNFMPGVEHIYNIHSIFEQTDRAPLVVDTATVANDLAGTFETALPSVEAVARLAIGPMQMKRGDVQAFEQIYWADAKIFSVLPLPVVAGNLTTALENADGIVLTRQIARKYFGSDQAIGEIVTLAGSRPMRVTAVIEDLPSNTNLRARIFAAGKAEVSTLTLLDRKQSTSGSNLITHILVRLKPQAVLADVQTELDTFFAARTQQAPGRSQKIRLIPLREVHTTMSELPGYYPPVDRFAMFGIGAIGIVILLVAAINFVNLMTARASRRSVEVGVRKVSGARRRHLIAQFIGEAMLYVLLSSILALGLMKLSLPALNAAIQRSISWSFSQDPTLTAAFVAIGIAVAVLSGAYPAFVLSSFRPSAVFRGNLFTKSHSGTFRQALVVGQFAILIGLILAAGIIARQTLYALREGVRVDTSGVMLVATNDCRQAFLDSLRALPDITGASCSSLWGLNIGQAAGEMQAPNGTQAAIFAIPTDENFLAFYRVVPVAGRLFSKDFGEDVATAGTRSLILNERAVRQLGYATPDDAIGGTVRWDTRPGVSGTFTIVGVVPNFAFNAVRQPVNPSGYYVDLAATNVINVRRAVGAPPATAAAIDETWKQFYPGRPITRSALQQYVLFFYGDVARLAGLLVFFALIAIFIASLGLFGLAAFTSEQRTKEIGIRKAMGASRRDILRLLLWQFAKPVLWASIIAWPVGYVIMRRWLEGFTQHITLGPGFFLAASGLAIIIALLTVTSHVLSVSRAQPVTALRYE
jgi:putative ABC transport system permease protein